MQNSIGLWNKTKSDLWFVLRSNDETGALIKLAPHDHKIVTLAVGEIVTSFMYDSQEEAAAAIGAHEMDRFSLEGLT